MKKITLIFLLITGLVFAQKKPAKVIPASSSVDWWMYQVVDNVPSTNSGTIKVKSGKFIFDKNDKVSDGEFILDMRSFASNNLTGSDKADLDERLRGSDYFFIKKFAFAKFDLKSIEMSKDPSSVYNAVVWGTFTMRGRSHTISFPAKLTVNGTYVMLESDKFTLNRQDWDIFYRSSRPNVLIKDDIDFKIKLVTK